MLINIKKFFFITNFFFSDLNILGKNVIFLFLLIYAQLMFVFQEIKFFQDYFLTLNFLLIALVAIQFFDQCLKQDLEDGSLEWILTQGLSEFNYFLARSFAFIGSVLAPLIGLTLILWWIQQNYYASTVSLFFAFLMASIQTVLLSGSFSLSSLFLQQGFHLSLPLCFLPLQLPTLIILHGLETGKITSSSTLLILGGLLLLSVGLSRFIVKRSLKSETIYSL